MRSCSRRSSRSFTAAAPTRIANRISGSTSPRRLRSLPTKAPNRFLGMNISTIAIGVTSGCSARFATCCAAAPPYSCSNCSRASGAIAAPGSITFIMTRPSVTAIAMFRKKSMKVRTASGPSVASRSSWAMPIASDANTSGITTKNSMRRKTWPIGSSTRVANSRATARKPGEKSPTSSVAPPARAPMTRPIRMRLASRALDSAVMFSSPGTGRRPQW